jgi:neutral ceramidase
MRILCRKHRRTLVWAIVFCGCAAVLPTFPRPIAAAELRVGTAAVKITPVNGTPMAGYYSRRDSQGVLDDLYAKAIVLDDGKTKAAMVVCDLIGVPRGPVLEARRIVEAQTGIPADQVMISATHAHTGPVVLGDSAHNAVITGGSRLSHDYVAQLPKWIAEAVVAANGRRTAARISYASEHDADVSFIRRFWMKDGTVAWNPGKRNPNVIRPIGDIDPQVNVAYAETLEQKPLLTYVNFPLHLDTTGGMLISADFPATIARRLADWRGPEMLTVFANGCCGNINHIDVQWATRQGGPEEARRIGTILAGDALKACRHLTPAVGPLRVRCQPLQLPLAPFSDDDLRQARELDAKRDANAPFLAQVKAYRVLDVAARKGKPFDVDLQVFALGQDVAWVALPGEVFVEIGLSIKAASPFRQTNVIELANGGLSYIPHRSAFSEGQYEVVSSRCAEGTGEMLVTTAVRLLAELHSEAAAAEKRL